ncbi:MAG: amidohydrolase [Crocinitomicaceae bacterium]|nr:amidohydrolase [Crocinitomicaceae bacterium]
MIKKSNELFEKVKSYREYLHQYPELSYKEENTAKFVEQVLYKIGVERIERIGKTGVTALILGDNHTLNDSFIGLRADLDALPIHEQNDRPYKSKNEGIMHACGHDVHTSILLGVAELLVAIKNELPFPIKLIFQPGEEQNPGGASILIKEGILENPTVDRLYALHVFPELEVGKIGFKEGLYMASCDELHLTIYGKGGHGATPHQCIDPIVIGATLVTSLQQIVSRSCDPKTPCVLTFGHFEALGATNIIPAKAHLKGTFRTMDETWREKALNLIETQISSIVATFGGSVELEIRKGYPCLFNDEHLTKDLKIKSLQIFQKQDVIDLPIRLTSEDFSFYSQKAPVCFFRLGVANKEKGIIYGVHHPQFDIDPESLKYGMRALALSVF